MAKDLVYTADIADAVQSVLKGADGTTHTGGLPANWFEDAQDEDEVPLKTLDHGYVADLAVVEASFLDLAPAILVRGFGPEITDGGTGGIYDTAEIIRVVHIRNFDQCRDVDGDPEDNMARAREWYAKQIYRALLNDPNAKLATIAADTTRTEVSLTTIDAAAAVHHCRLDRFDPGAGIGHPHSIEDVALIRALGQPIWAIAADIIVKVTSG